MQLVEVAVEHASDLPLLLLAAGIHHIEPRPRQVPLDLLAHEIPEVCRPDRVEFARQLAALQNFDIAVSLEEPAVPRILTFCLPECRLQPEFSDLLWRDRDALEVDVGLGRKLAQVLLDCLGCLRSAWVEIAQLVNEDWAAEAVEMNRRFVQEADRAVADSGTSYSRVTGSMTPTNAFFSTQIWTYSSVSCQGSFR